MTIARGYKRVSTDEQAKEGYSLEAQENSIRAIAKEKGWEIAEIYKDEGVSAKGMKKRPGLRRLLEDMRRDEVLIVWKLDRLNRNVLDSETIFRHLDDQGALFYSIAEPQLSSAGPGGKFTRHIMQAVAELYSGMLGENVRHGMAQLVQKGKWSGGLRPFGYDITKDGLRPNEQEAPVVRRIFDWYIAGFGTRAIAIKLNDSGIRTAQGSIWRSATVSYILRQVLYCGKVSFGRRFASGKPQPPERLIIAEGAHEAIVDRQTWDGAQAIMARHKKMGSRHASGTHPFTGIARCELCGAAVGGVTYKGDKVHLEPRRKYRCAKRQHTKLCTLPIQSADRLEAIFLAELARLLDSPGELEKMMAPHEPPAIEADTADSLRDQVEKVDKQISRWQAAYNAETLDLDEFAAKVKPLREQRKGLVSHIELLARQATPARVEEAKRAAASLLDAWAVATWTERKELIHQMCERIWIGPGYTIRFAFRMDAA